MHFFQIAKQTNKKYKLNKQAQGRAVQCDIYVARATSKHACAKN